MTILPFAIEPAVSALAAALAVGAVVGLERGWRDRERRDGSRVAGLRTFSLLGLLGGVLGVLSDSLGVWPVAGGLIGLSVLAAVSYREGVRSHGSLSATTSVAALLTYSLGVLAGVGHAALAIGVAVVAAVLLNLKPTLHRWLQLVEYRELSAALQLLVLSAVILPLLPNAAYGPYGALNPYLLWWAVVLVAALSLGGHIAMRLTGPARGIFWTGVLGGLASSTAVTLTLARRAKQQPALTRAATAGILAACGMMFLRMTVIVWSIQPAFYATLGIPMIAGGVTLVGLGAWRWRRCGAGVETNTEENLAVFDLSTALIFGALLGAMAILIQAATQWLGSTGLFMAATLSGMIDVDAITITVMRMQAIGNLTIQAAHIALGLAIAANMLTKILIAIFAGSVLLARPVVMLYCVSIAVGAVFFGLVSLL
jgi:uncharacterized membrane protein (DUF4010 family)